MQQTIFQVRPCALPASGGCNRQSGRANKQGTCSSARYGRLGGLPPLLAQDSLASQPVLWRFLIAVDLMLKLSCKKVYIQNIHKSTTYSVHFSGDNPRHV